MNIQIPANKLSPLEKMVYYKRFYKDIFLSQAVFSDETPQFRTPVEPSAQDEVTVRIRTAKNNVDSVILHYENQKLPMKKSETTAQFDYYQLTLPPEKEAKRYSFECRKGMGSFFYSKRGVTKAKEAGYPFIILRDFQSPDWAKGAVMYQIFTDRFCNGDKNNDVLDNEYIYLGKPSFQVKDWNALPEPDDIRNFYGGDLQGVIHKMEYLSSLGVDAIYFNPLFVSPSTHKYDAQDYDYIDPHFGVILKDGGEPLQFEKFNNRYAEMYIQRTTDFVNLEASNKLFIQLVQIAHTKGIKVILDGVFNHCGAFHKWLDREGFYHASGQYPAGAYKEKESVYHDYFKWYDTENWPNNDCYDGWWGYDNHPKLNYEESKSLYRYILEVGAKWVSPPFNADGWRLDVAADLGYSEDFNHQFWKDFRSAVKKANPNAIILAEHYGDASRWLEGTQWDTLMNYDAFMEPISWFLTGMEKHSEQYREDLYNNAQSFKDAMEYHMAKMSYPSLYTAMNELSNHDHSRFLTRTNRTPGRLHTVGSQMAEWGVSPSVMRLAVLFQMTWPGAPTIYYGDEVGLCGWTDPDNRRPFPWGREDAEMLAFHKDLISLRKCNSVWKTGSVLFLTVDYGVLCYARFTKEEKMVIVLNNQDQNKEISIPVWKIGVADTSMISVFHCDQQGHENTSQTVPIIGGTMKLQIPAKGGMILKGERE